MESFLRRHFIMDNTSYALLEISESRPKVILSNLFVQPCDNEFLTSSIPMPLR
jgi:hypothetical protein